MVKLVQQKWNPVTAAETNSREIATVRAASFARPWEFCLQNSPAPGGRRARNSMGGSK